MVVGNVGKYVYGATVVIGGKKCSLLCYEKSREELRDICSPGLSFVDSGRDDRRMVISGCMLHTPKSCDQRRMYHSGVMGRNGIEISGI